MKKLLVGFSNNIAKHQQKIKLWIYSFREYSEARIVLIAANVSDEDRSVLKTLDVDFIEVVVEQEKYINHKRIEHILNFLKDTDEELVLSTDVFDVAFQSDPFELLDTDKYDFFVGGEGVLVEQEPWNHRNIELLFPELLNENVKKHEVICSGVMAGKREAFISVYEKMFELCENNEDGHDIKDQAALIVMIASNIIPKLKIFTLDEGWTIHCAVAGPTKFFEAWAFKQNIKYQLPQILNRTVCTGSGKPYAIVHQFNRVPLWNQILQYKYLYKPTLNKMQNAESVENEEEKLSLQKPIIKNHTKSAITICTYSKGLSGGFQENVNSYAKAGVDDVFVLFDTDNCKATTNDIIKAFNGKVCIYSIKDFIKKNYNRPIDRKHRWGSHQNPKYFYPHFRMLLLYENYPDYDYYWFFDDDVTFSGDIKNLLDTHDQMVDADYLAIQAFKKKDYADFPNISVINDRMKGSHGQWLSQCPGPGDVFKKKNKHIGSFFPIVRFSNIAMQFLIQTNKENYYGYSEGFVPTTLASFDFKVASMLDEYNKFFIGDFDCQLFHKGEKFTWEWL